MATPSTVPKAIANTKDAATRARVIAILKKSAPDLASAAITDTTASGAGSTPGEAMLEPNCHARTSSRSGASLKIRFLVFLGSDFCISIENSLVEFLCVADKVRASNFCQDSVKRARVGGFLGH